MDDKTRLELYRVMVLSRPFEEAILRDYHADKKPAFEIGDPPGRCTCRPARSRWPPAYAHTCTATTRDNDWAISVARSASTAIPSNADRAAAYGIPGQRIEDNDVEAGLRTAADRGRNPRRRRDPPNQGRGGRARRGGGRFRQEQSRANARDGARERLRVKEKDR